MGNSKEIKLKLAGKSGATVVLHTLDYMQEALRQLEDDKYYSPLEEDPTRKYNVEILQVIKEVTNLSIIDENMQKTFYNKFPRISSFYMLPEIHKSNNPGRLLFNSIGSITENISAYINQPRNLRPLVSKIPSYIKDATYILNLMIGKTLMKKIC